MHYESLYEENQLSAPSIRNCGFEEAPSAQLPYFLYQTQPSLQAACLRESLLVSMTNFQKLQNILLQANTAKRWKFYNIVICSLPDKVSKITRKQMIEQIIRMNSLWAVAEFKTFFIPIDMGDINIQEILGYCEIGGPGWQYYPSDLQNFTQVFRNLATEMSMINKRSLLASGASEQNFEAKIHEAPALDYSLAVSLTIQASQNMAGHRWETIINTICFYMRNLGPRDLISGVVFNNRTAIGAKNQSLQNLIEPQRMQAQPQVRAGGYVPPQQYHPLPPQPGYNQNQNYAQYAPAAPAVRRNNPNQNNNCKLCGICCCLLIFGFVIRLIIVLSATSNAK